MGGLQNSHCTPTPNFVSSRSCFSMYSIYISIPVRSEFFFSEANFNIIFRWLLFRKTYHSIFPSKISAFASIVQQNEIQPSDTPRHYGIGAALPGIPSWPSHFNFRAQAVFLVIGFVPANFFHRAFCTIVDDFQFFFDSNSTFARFLTLYWSLT